MRIAWALLFLVLASAVAAQPAMSKKEAKVRAWLERGKAYKAIRQCDAMLGRDPQPVFYALRADAYNRIAEFEKAERDARAGLKAFPGDQAALLQLAIAEQGLGRADSAVAHLEVLVKVAPSAEVRYRLAMVYQLAGRYPEALQQARAAMAGMAEGNRDAARFHRLEGEDLALMNDTAAARMAFQQAISSDPADPVNYNSRGWFLYAAFGDHAHAIADYDKAIALNPNYSYAFNNRGWSRYKSGDREGGLSDIERARRRKIFNPYVYRNLGLIALDGGNKAEACTHFRHALELNFTALYGHEVEQLIAANCTDVDKDHVPTQAPNAPMNAPGSTPIQRTNAP